MAGKSGGFFKRLKKKQKEVAKKASRGTTGMKKSDRILKHNAMVDINQTKRKINEMDAITDSDDESVDSNVSDASSDHIDFNALATGKAVGVGANGLDKLRSLLGVSATPAGGKKGATAAATSAKKAAADSDDDDFDEDDEDLLGDDDGDADSLGDMAVDENADGDDVYDKLEQMQKEEDAALAAMELEEGMEEEDEEDLEELEEEDGGYMVPESNWDDLFKNVEGATGASAAVTGGKKNLKTTQAAAPLTGKRGREAAADEDDDVDEFGAEDDYDAADGEDDEEVDNEDEAGADGGSDNEATNQEHNVAQLLPEFKLSISEMNQIKKIDSQALTAAIVERDPWYARYYAPATASGSNKCNPLTVLAAEDRPALQAAIQWEEPTLNPQTELIVKARATPTASAIIASIEKDDEKKSVAGSSSSSANVVGVRPPYVHDIAWDLWCHYRAKLQHQQKLKAAAEAAKAANASKTAAPTTSAAANAAAVNEASSATYRGAMSEAEIAAAGLMAPHEVAYFHMLQSYGDMLDASKSWDNNFARRELVSLHLINHWLKTKTLVTAHNEVLNRRRKAKREKRMAKIAELKEQAKKEGKKYDPKGQRKGIAVVSDSDSDDDDAAEFRDQSFGKTRMMIMLPMRNAALEYVESILRILYAKETDDQHVSENLQQTMGAEAAWHVDNDPYRLYRKATQGPNAGHEVATRCEFFTANKHVRKLDTFRGDFSEVEESLTLRTFRKRPEEFRQTFYGNMDDCFCFGMSLGLPPSATGTNAGKKSSGTQYTSIYSHVLNSDIIICSPLGLRKRLGKSGDVIVSLSSVEVTVVDQADVLVMQNWEHLQEVVKLLNDRPRETTEGLAQISRLFEWAMRSTITKTNPLPVSAHGRRQNIIMTALSHVNVQSTFRAMNTYDVEDHTAGDDEYTTLFKAASFYIAPAKHTGVIAKVPIPVRQHFLRYDASSIAASDDERFEYFTQQLYPSRIQSLIDREVRTILFVPSYFDYVRLRNHFFQEQRDLTAFLSEYSTEKQQRQVLGQFTDMERPFLIMTERFYFFKRYFVRLAEQLVFYSPPLFPNFYSTLIGKLNADSPNTAVMLIYGKYDTHELVRIAGTERAKQLLERAATSYAFVTNGGVV